MFYDSKEYIQMLEITLLELAMRLPHCCLSERSETLVFQVGVTMLEMMGFTLPELTLNVGKSGEGLKKK